jgi:putative CocE/NonD family hydrolase
VTVEYEVLRPAPLDPRAVQTMVPMRDGVRLATDAYLPDNSRRVPAVLVRLPYDKSGRYTYMPQLASHFNERGYAFVAQDVRGKFRSEGETMPFVREVEDGYDTLDWVAAQPWCDGRVGMWGDSYYGYTQWAAAASGHPALKAIVPRVTSTDFKMANWWGDSVVLLYAAQYLAECWLDNSMYHIRPDWSIRPLAGVFDEVFAAVGKRSACHDLMIGVRGPNDQALDFSRRPFNGIKIPVLHSTGWFDNISPYSFADYERLIGQNGQRGCQYLVADATDHEMYHLRHVPIKEQDDHTVSEPALARVIAESVGPALDFFDVFIRGEGGADTVPRAKWFLGNVEWRTSPAWPPPESRELRLYLGSPEQATKSVEGGTLLPTPDRAAGEARWLHDPSNLVPSTSEDPFALLHEWADESPVQGRDDVLTFSSEPLAEPLDLAGPVDAWLSVGSTCASTHVYVKLCDVFPDGSTHMLVRGESLVQEKDYERLIEMRLSHTAYRLLPGHRLRLSIASSDYPLYLWHPGTNENPWLATKGVANGQALATGGSSPSYLRLTILP